jgi:hypothetical protein
MRCRSLQRALVEGSLGMAACGLGIVVPDQALTEAARREAERRATMPRAERVLTNADLGDAPRPVVVIESSGVWRVAPTPDVSSGAMSGDSTAAETRQRQATPARVESGSRRTVATPDATVPSPDGPADGVVRDEAWWRQQAEALSRRRHRLAEQQRALQNRIDMLTAEVAGRDDPYQRTVLEDDRRRSIEELDALERDRAELDRAVTAFEESARRQAVPAAWIRLDPG